jgi:hypothetical protein
MLRDRLINNQSQTPCIAPSPNEPQNIARVVGQKRQAAWPIFSTFTPPPSSSMTLFRSFTSA